MFRGYWHFLQYQDEEEVPPTPPSPSDIRPSSSALSTSKSKMTESMDSLPHAPPPTTAQLQEEFNNTPIPIAEIGSSKKYKLFESAILDNSQRDELFVEIFTYFQWLKHSLSYSHNGGRRPSNAGFNITGVNGVLKSLEFGFKAVRDNSLTLNRVAEGLAKDGKAPFLEQYCKGELKKRMKETIDVDVPQKKIDSKTWEERYIDLIHHKSVINDCSRQELNERSEGLGDWLQKQIVLYANQDVDFMKNRAPKLNAAGLLWWRLPSKKKTKPPTTKQRIKKTPPPWHQHQQHQRYIYIPPQTTHPPFPTQFPLIPQIAATVTATKPRKFPQPSTKPSPLFKKQAPPYDFDSEFNLLLEYKAEHGNLIVSSQTRLGRWMALLRLKFGEIEVDNSFGDEGGTSAAGAAAAGTGDARAYTRIWTQAPPGRLGLVVKFTEGTEGAEVTSVYDSCAFLSKVKVGDCITKIDDHIIVKPDDLSIRMDVSRTICIAKKKKTQKLAGAGLTQDQIERLNSIGFDWKGRGKLRSWELTYQDLLTYYQNHGDFRIPRTYRTDCGHHLGEWVHRQRYLYSAKKPTFMADRAETLDAIGFEWKPRKSDFQSNFKELVEYKQIHGHVNVPWNNSRQNDYRLLGRWAASIRYSRNREEEKARHGKAEEEEKRKYGGHTYEILSAEQIKLLDSIGFDWTLTKKRRPHGL